ncbi:hypothetical protein DFH06DRAFT_1220080 [Mycena polygramma]|nr:hypothetical protein DFH06DRAFT_1220080 [Mycena polygramma]
MATGGGMSAASCPHLRLCHACKHRNRVLQRAPRSHPRQSSRGVPLLSPTHCLLPTPHVGDTPEERKESVCVNRNIRCAHLFFSSLFMHPQSIRDACSSTVDAAAPVLMDTLLHTRSSAPRRRVSKSADCALSCVSRGLAPSHLFDRLSVKEGNEKSKVRTSLSLSPPARPARRHLSLESLYARVPGAHLHPPHVLPCAHRKLRRRAHVRSECCLPLDAFLPAYQT